MNCLPVTTEKGTDTNDVEGDSKEEAEKLEVAEQNKGDEQKPAEAPDGSAAGSAAPSKLSIRSSANDTVTADATEVGSPKEDAKGSRVSVRSIAREQSRGCINFLY